MRQLSSTQAQKLPRSRVFVASLRHVGYAQPLFVVRPRAWNVFNILTNLEKVNVPFLPFFCAHFKEQLADSLVR